MIVGRPNVGKSTVFNRITGQRRSIVGDEPGITRDRIHGFATHERRRFELIDTGGVVVSDADYIPSQILAQARVALEQAAQVIFIVDGRSEITASDRELAAMLRKVGKPVSLVVNKCDTGAKEDLIHDFYSLGIKDIFPVSAEHGMGMDAMLDHVTKDFPEEDAAEEVEARGIRIAIIGRPNVGKSTLLLNALTGKDRAIVSPYCRHYSRCGGRNHRAQRDEIRFRRYGGDPAQKGKTKEMTEKLSVVMARRHIRMCDVVLLVMDARATALSAAMRRSAVMRMKAERAGDSVREQVGSGDFGLKPQGVRAERARSFEVSRLRADDFHASALEGTGVTDLLESDQARK